MLLVSNMEFDKLKEIYILYKVSSDKQQFTTDYITKENDDLSIAFALALEEAGSPELDFNGEKDRLMRRIENLVEDSPIRRNSSFTGLVPMFYLSEDTNGSVEKFVQINNDLESVYGFMQDLQLSDLDRSCIFYKGLKLANKIKDRLPGHAEKLYEKIITEYL